MLHFRVDNIKIAYRGPNVYAIRKRSGNDPFSHGIEDELWDAVKI
jgi:hypothetical protein